MRLIALIPTSVLCVTVTAEKLSEIYDPDLYVAIVHLRKVRRQRDPFSLIQLLSGSERSRYFRQLSEFMNQDVEWQYLIANRNPDLRAFLIDFDTWLRLYHADVARAPEFESQKIIQAGP